MFILILALLVLCGCSQSAWTHPVKNQDEFKRDSYECELEVRQVSASFQRPRQPEPQWPSAADAYGAPIGRAFSNLGAELGEADDRRAFFNRCMEARGYRLQQTPPASNRLPDAGDEVKERPPIVKRSVKKDGSPCWPSSVLLNPCDD